ncbi:MAG: hypothetical protein OHK0046_50650 [Anaerolineae bacterium]
MSLAFILFFGGAVVVLWIFLWSRLHLRKDTPHPIDFDALMKDVPAAAHGDALLVSQEHGKLVYANGPARQWMNMNGGVPHLEYMARMAQPADSFLELFAGETQASFQLGQRWVEASSHQVPSGSAMNTVVVMRELSATASNPEALNLSAAMSIINEIGDTVNASMGVEQVIQTLLNLISRHVKSFSGGEICLWDENSRSLRQSGWVGDDPNYPIALSTAGGRYNWGEGLTGWIAQHRKPILLSSRNDISGVQPKLMNTPFESFVGVPLILGDRFVGTIEFASSQPRNFTQADVALLQALSKPCAVAIFNAEIYTEQVRRVDDLANLQEIVRHEDMTDGAPLFAVLSKRIAALMNTSMAGVFLYDDYRKGLVPQMPFHGLPDAAVQRLFIPLTADSPQKDIWENQSYWLSNHVVDEPLVAKLGLQWVVDGAGLYNTLWVPLYIATERIGVITVTNKRGGGDFNIHDVTSLTLLATQTATVIENWRLHRREKRLDTERDGLQKIADAIGALSHETEFYGEITSQIAELMGVSMCGILIYEDDSQRLLSKTPFFGAADSIASEYMIQLKPGSVIEELWETERYWISNRVRIDPLMAATNIDDLLARMRVEKTIMAVLYANNRRLGLIQIANKLSGDDFTDSDANLLLIFATQAATIIENARLYQEAQRSAEQAQGLRDVAELAGYVLTSQESFAPVLAKIAELMNSELVFVNVLDQQNGTLVTYPRWVHGMELSEPIRQDIYAPGFETSVAVSHSSFISNDVLHSDLVIDSYRQIALRLNIYNAIVVPMVFGGHTLGEIGVANRHDGPYLPEEIETMETIAAQTAAALDRLLRYEEKGENLSRREEELDAILRVSNELNTTVELRYVIDVICEEAVRATGAMGSTFVLLRGAEFWLYPDVPEMQERIGANVENEGLADIEVEAVMRGADTVLITDYDFSNMRAAPEQARSAVAAAVIHTNQVIGVLHLYHTSPNYFDDRSASFLLALAVKASLGYNSYIRFEEQRVSGERLRRRVDQLNRIFEFGHMFQSAADPVSILEAIAYAVQQSVGYDTVLMTLVDERNGVLRRVAQAGMPMDVFEASQPDVMRIDTLEMLLRDEYRINESYSGSYFFPIEKVREWFISDEIQALSTSYEANRSIGTSGRTGWRDGDVFLVKMTGATGQMIGVMSLDRPHDNRRPDGGTVEILEIFAHQAATTIENTRLYLGSIRNANQESYLNDLMEAVAGTLDVTDVVKAMAHGLLPLVSFNRLTVAIADEDNFTIIRGLVRDNETIDFASEERSTLGNTAVNRTYREGQDYIYRVGDDAIQQYEDLNVWYRTGERLSLVMPLIAGGQSLGVLHIGCNLPDNIELIELRPLLRRVAHLAAAVMQNARLYLEALNLKGLNESVLESIQQGIVVLDSSGRIISLNSFMEQRYHWPIKSMKGHDLFTERPELVEFLHDHVVSVLEGGEPTELIHQVSTGDEGQQLLTNFYIYPLRFQETVRGAVMLVEDVTARTQLEQTMETRANQLAALTEVSSHITSSLERDEVVHVALDEMEFLIDYNAMTLWRRNGSYMVLEGAKGLVDEAGDQTEEEVRFLISDYEPIQQVVESQRVISADSVLNAPVIVPLHQAVGSWMGVPLVNQGHVVGMMMLSHRRHEVYNNRADQNIALAFAGQVAIALANADLFEQTFDRTNELGTLLEAANTTSMAADLNAVFRTVTELMFSALDMDDCAIMIWDEVDNELEVQVDMNRSGNADRITPKGTVYDLSKYPAKMHALREREVIVITRNDTDSPYPEEYADLVSHGDSVRMLVPLVISEQPRGLIQLEHSGTESVVTAQKVRLARALGAQVAIAIENARLSQETTLHFEESLIINDLSRAISSTLEVSDMIDIVADQLPNVISASEIYLALYDPKTEMIEFPFALRHGERYTIPSRPLGSDEVSYVIENRRALTLGSDYFSPDELRRSMGITNGEGDVKSYLGVPLMAGDVVNGVLAVRDMERRRAFSVNEQRILTTVGAQVGAAVQNARLFNQISSFADDLNRQVRERTYELEERTNELEEERDRIDTLYQITSELARTLDMERLMPRALGMVAKAVGAQDGVIMQLDPITDQLYSRAVLNPNSLQHFPDSEHPIHPAERIARWLIEEDEPVKLVEDLHEEDYWDQEFPGAGRWRSALAVLLETNEELLGVMVVMSDQVNAFVESHLRLMVAAANQVASSINNAELYKLIRDQAERLGSLLRTEQEEAEKNKAILEGIADGVILADASGAIVLFNSAAERILQIPRDQVLGQPISKLTGAYGGSAARWTLAMERQTQDGDFDDEFIDERLQLGDRTVSVHLSPVYTGEKFLGTVSVFRDITREVEADRSKSKFVANVSHEFRTPLTPIKGFVDMVLMGATGEINDTQRSILTTVKSNIDRLVMLVEEVLSISQMDIGDDRMRIDKVDVNMVIERILESMVGRPKHQTKHLEVFFEPVPTLPMIQADIEKVTRILGNIIDNAFSYTRDGGVVEVKASQVDEQYILITVKDTGVGIPADFRERVWQRFERHDETALELDVAGTGLGLPIVKELVEMHSGQVWFESEEGVGTIFYISLPITQPDYLTSDVISKE